MYVNENIIESAVSKKILFLGQDINDLGGIATVLNNYKIICEQFNFVRTNTKMKSSKAQKIMMLFESLFIFLKYCISLQIKIIHINTAAYNDFFRNSLFIVVGKLFRKKIVLQIHDGAFEEFYKKYLLFVKIMIKKCDYIITVSKFLSKVIKKISTDVVVIYNMVDKPLLEKVKKNRLNILFLGAIIDDKGIFDVLGVFTDNYHYFMNNVTLHIGGIGDVRRLKNIIIQKKLEKFVIYHGWLDKLEKHKLLSQSDVLIQPSYFEGFGISIAEGMSYGLPIIATNVGGIPELVENKLNGFLIPPGDKTQIFEAIKIFIENPKLIEIMGQESKKKVIPFYKDNVLKKMKDFYVNIFTYDL
jgi:glycosyltransferase involved in cell wall biosynthesis